MEWKMFFDYDYPSAREIKERYEGRIIDLNAYSGLTHANVVEAVLTLPRVHALALPSSYQFWNRSETYKTGGIDVPLDTPQRFNKFGPEANLNTTKMGVRTASGNNFLPVPAMREAAKDMSVEQAYRGFGYWGVRTKQHHIMPFEVLAEGRKFYEAFGKDVKVIYQHGDIYYVVPSASRPDRKYEIHLRPMPTEGDFNAAWTETLGDCGCESSAFGEIRSKKKIDDVYVDLSKYSKGEHVTCRHKRAAYERACEESKKPGMKPVLVGMFPRATGILDPWFVLKNYTIITDSNGRHARRPLKTEDRITLGRVIAYDPERMFAW